jgi:protein-tyrosine sulfotransferase
MPTVIKDPIFILYDARSGSNYLANLLVKRLNIVIPPESNFIPIIFRHFSKKTIDTKRELDKIIDIAFMDDKFTDWKVRKDIILNIIENELPITIGEFILTICTIYKESYFSEASAMCIKKGDYLKYHFQLKSIFPKSKFIILIRDGRAVYNSKKNSIKSKTGRPFETNPIRAAKVWCKKIDVLNYIKNKYDVDSTKIYYEQLIRDKESTLSKISDFLKLTDNKNRTLNSNKYRVPSRYGDLHKNIKKETLTHRIKAWRNELSDYEIFEFESVAYQHLLLEGYELVNNVTTLKNTITKLKNKLRIFQTFNNNYF